jgi:hypothetical protein
MDLFELRHVRTLIQQEEKTAVAVAVMVSWVAIFVVVDCERGRNVRRWASCDRENHCHIQTTCRVHKLQKNYRLSSIFYFLFLKGK